MIHTTEKPIISFDTAQLEAEFDSIAQKGIDQRVFPGCTVGAILNGKWVNTYQGGHVYEECLCPVARDSFYDVASITKPIAALVLMILIKKQRITLADKVCHYLPSFKNAGKAGKEMRIRHLLTSCVRLQYPQWANSATKKGIHSLPEEDRLKAVLESSLVDFPGYTFNYNNITSLLIGFIVEKVAKMSLEMFIVENLFKPFDLQEFLCFKPLLKGIAPEQIAPTHKDDRGLDKPGEVFDPLAHSFGDRPTAPSGIFATLSGMLGLSEAIITYGHDLIGENFDRLTINQVGNLINPMTGKTARWSLGFDLFAPDYLPEFPDLHKHAFLMTGSTGCIWVMIPKWSFAFVHLSNAVYEQCAEKDEDGHMPIYHVRKDLLRAALKEVPEARG